MADFSRNRRQMEKCTENADMWRWWGRHTLRAIKVTGNARNGKFSVRENVIVPLALCRRRP